MPTTAPAMAPFREEARPADPRVTSRRFCNRCEGILVTVMGVDGGGGGRMMWTEGSLKLCIFVGPCVNLEEVGPTRKR